jgi:hypothetical protein
MKYTTEIVKKICDLIEKDTFTIPEICEQVGIKRTTFFRWQDEKQDFKDSLKAAYDKRLTSFAEAALHSLRKKIEGYDYDETTVIYTSDKEGKPKIKEKKTVKKHVAPSDTAIIFTLTNRDSLNWKHKSEVQNDITSKGKELSTNINVSHLTIEEINKLLNDE